MPERIAFDRPPPTHRPGPLGALLGTVRIAGVLALAAVGALVVPAVALVPGRVRGVRPALWVVHGLARLFVALFAVRLRGPDPRALRGHHGLVFINHLSYLDPVVVEALAPTRFMSAAGVRRLPFVGWIARAVGTVFVDRGDGASRAASRRALVGKLRRRAHPPIVVAPEGQIGPGGGVLPFRHGALEVARDAGVTVLPLVIRYEPFDAAAWGRGEWILQALWRLAARTAPFTATVTPLPPVAFAKGDAVAAAADVLEARYDAVLAG